MAGSGAPLPPSARKNFLPTTVFHVTQPQQLPWTYSWLAPGLFGLYRGQVRYPGDQLNPADWGWEIEYVNGHDEEGERSSLGYSIFLSEDSLSFGKVANLPGIERFSRGMPDPGRRQQVPMALSLPVLFPCISQEPMLATTVIETPLGNLSCFSLERHGLGYMRGIGYYEASRYILVGLDVQDSKMSICTFRLSETNVSLSAARAKGTQPSW
jgi:hypothetical protein